MEFVTPLKLVQDGKVVSSLTFSLFARALMRRASAMAYYYGGTELPLDFRSLAYLSESVLCASSGMRLVRWGSRVTGMTGRATFTGALTDFHLLLLMGSSMHLGKGAPFGQGAFLLAP